MTPFQYRIISKMMASEDGEEYYELNTRYAITLLHLGFITIRRWNEIGGGNIYSFSNYFVTDKGREAHKNWKGD